jgi:hypothetical protein
MDDFLGGNVSKLDSHQGLFIRDIFIPFNLLFDFLGSLGIFKIRPMNIGQIIIKVEFLSILPKKLHSGNS